MKEYALTCKIEIEKKKTPIGSWFVNGVKEELFDVTMEEFTKDINEEIQNPNEL